MADRLYATSHFTDLYFHCRIYDLWQVLNFTYFCFSLKAVCHACFRSRLSVGYFSVFLADLINHLLVLPADLQW